MTSKGESSVYRIPPYHYIHVLDQNENVTRLEIGPKTFVKQDNEKVIYGPEKMITIPPRHFCVVENPVLKDKENKIVFDQSGQAKLGFADLEYRFGRDPFPLYPGEVLKQNVTPLRVIPANSALRLKAVLDFDDENGIKI
jgi:major vault protein